MVHARDHILDLAIFAARCARAPGPGCRTPRGSWIYDTLPA
jgi:hypothetical protein